VEPVKALDMRLPQKGLDPNYEPNDQGEEDE